MVTNLKFGERRVSRRAPLESSARPSRSHRGIWLRHDCQATRRHLSCFDDRDLQICEVRPTAILSDRHLRPILSKSCGRLAPVPVKDVDEEGGAKVPLGISHKPVSGPRQVRFGFGHHERELFHGPSEAALLETLLRLLPWETP
jgi:hypothetical protein